MNESAVGGVPVYNVAVHVTGRDFYVSSSKGTTSKSIRVRRDCA